MALYAAYVSDALSVHAVAYEQIDQSILIEEITQLWDVLRRQRTNLRRRLEHGFLRGMCFQPTCPGVRRLN